MTARRQPTVLPRDLATLARGMIADETAKGEQGSRFHIAMAESALAMAMREQGTFSRPDLVLDHANGATLVDSIRHGTVDADRATYHRLLSVAIHRVGITRPGVLTETERQMEPSNGIS